MKEPRNEFDINDTTLTNVRLKSTLYHVLYEPFHYFRQRKLKIGHATTSEKADRQTNKHASEVSQIFVVVQREHDASLFCLCLLLFSIYDQYTVLF